MRTWRLVAGAAALLVVVAGKAGAQALPVSLSLGGGPTFSSQDGRGTGYHGLVGLALGAPLVPLAVRVDGTLNRFNETEVDTRLFALTGNVMYRIGGAPLVAPYLIGGVGYYNTRFSQVIERVKEHQTDSDFGFNVGVGVRFSLLVVGAFAEVRYHSILGTDTNGERVSSTFVPVTFGIRF